MSNPRHVVVEADGGSRGNPGPAGYGAVVRDARSGELLAERNASLGVTTNNVAEYSGLIAGLTAARDLGATQVEVRMDSRLVVEQMAGRWQVKHPSMRPLAAQAAALVRSFGSVTFEWVPRERNKHADRLANEAMDAAAGRPVSRAEPRAHTRADPRVDPRAEQPPNWMPPGGTPTRLLLVRHGATEHSAQRRFSGRNDLALDAAGERQAAAVARRLAARTDVRAVVSSPLRRARQTADLVGAGLGLEVTESPDFAELDFGAWEGLTMREVADRFPGELSAWAGSAASAPPGGESFAALARRVRRGRDAVVAAHPGGTVVVVTHVTPIKTLVQVALDAPASALFRLHLDPASLTVLEYYDTGDVRMSLFNDASHLSS